MWGMAMGESCGGSRLYLEATSIVGMRPTHINGLYINRERNATTFLVGAFTDHLEMA